MAVGALGALLCTFKKEVTKIRNLLNKKQIKFLHQSKFNDHRGSDSYNYSYMISLLVFQVPSWLSV